MATSEKNSIHGSGEVLKIEPIAKPAPIELPD